MPRLAFVGLTSQTSNDFFKAFHRCALQLIDLIIHITDIIPSTGCDSRIAGNTALSLSAGTHHLSYRQLLSSPPASASFLRRQSAWRAPNDRQRASCISLIRLQGSKSSSCNAPAAGRKTLSDDPIIPGTGCWIPCRSLLVSWQDEAGRIKGIPCNMTWLAVIRLAASRLLGLEANAPSRASSLPLEPWGTCGERGRM